MNRTETPVTVRIVERVYRCLMVVGAETEFQIIGVVEGFKQWGLDQEASVEMFVPYRSFIGDARNFNVVVKTERPLAVIADNLRAAVWDVLPSMPVNSIYTMRQQMSESMSTPRFYSVMLATFGTVALLLAAGGVYGSMLYSVGRRNRELGVRMALGATTSNVTGMVLRQGVVLAAIGITIGLAGSIALGRVLESFMFGITTTDSFTLTVVSVVLALVAVASCYLPARKACLRQSNRNTPQRVVIFPEPWGYKSKASNGLGASLTTFILLTIYI